MAIIDKKGFVHGKAGGQVFRQLGDKLVMQVAPRNVKQTDATKISAKEFGLASSAAKVLRHIFAGPSHCADGRMIGRLTQTVLKALREGKKNEQGLRDLHQGDLSLLEGFQFNSNSPLQDVLEVSPEVILGEGGAVSVNLPGIDKGQLFFPKYSFSCTLRLLVVEVNFKKETYQYLDHRDIRIKEGDGTEELLWEVEEKAEAGSMVMVSLSLHYFSHDGVNEEGISLNNTNFSPAGIIAAMHVGEDGAAARAENTEPYKIPMAGYDGNFILRDLERMLAKMKKTKSPAATAIDKGSGSGGLPRLVKGKIAFKK
jgi:hypothetical protein